jgi:formiminotetrahydrofolate cyclodeaminase
MEFAWVLIPVVAIVAGLVRDLFKLRAKQQVLGTSNRQLEKTVEELRQTNQSLAQRVENLETIVVSQTWNALNAPGASDAERQQRLAAAVRQEVHAPVTEDVNQQRAADLARRLGG